MKEGLGVTGATSSLAENGADVAALHGGGFVVTWTEPATGGTDIHATIMSNDGLPIAFGLLVNTTTPRNQSASDVVALDDGGFLVTWEDVVAGTRGQRFDALGHQIGAEFTLDTGTQTGHRDAAVLDDGRIAFALDHVSIDFDVTTSIFTDDTPLDFNANGLSDILWQNERRHARDLADERLDGVSDRPRRPVQSGAELARQGQRRLQRRRQADILWQNDDGTPAIWLMNGTQRAIRRRGRLVQSGAELADRGHRRLQRRRQVRHSVAERRRHAGDLADERLDRAVRRRRRPFNPGPSWQIAGTGDFNGDGKADILWQNDDGTPAIWLMNGTNRHVRRRRRSVQSGTELADQGHRRLQRRRQVRHPVAGNDGTPAIWLMDGTMP